jgi:hypothetical protein
MVVVFRTESTAAGYGAYNINHLQTLMMDTL